MAIVSFAAAGALLWWPSAKSTSGEAAALDPTMRNFVPASNERSAILTPLDASVQPHDAAPALSTRDAGLAVPARVTPIKKHRVIPNKKADEQVNKTASKGSVVIHVRPWGEVHIDGKFAGRSEPPSGKRFSLAEGRHTISVRNSVTGGRQVRQVSVDPQKPLTLRIDLRKKPDQP